MVALMPELELLADCSGLEHALIVRLAASLRGQEIGRCYIHGQHLKKRVELRVDSK